MPGTPINPKARGGTLKLFWMHGGESFPKGTPLVANLKPEAVAEREHVTILRGGMPYEDITVPSGHVQWDETKK